MNDIFEERFLRFGRRAFAIQSLRGLAKAYFRQPFFSSSSSGLRLELRSWCTMHGHL